MWHDKFSIQSNLKSFASSFFALTVLHVPSGAIEPVPKIDGRHRSALTMQENATHKFSCHSDGWHPRAPPTLTWYLNGEQQSEPLPKRGRLVMTSQEDSEVMRPRTRHNSTFSLQAKKWDRELVCTASNPRTGESYNATVTLNIQCEYVCVGVCEECDSLHNNA